MIFVGKRDQNMSFCQEKLFLKWILKSTWLAKSELAAGAAGTAGNFVDPWR